MQTASCTDKNKHQHLLQNKTLTYTFKGEVKMCKCAGWNVRVNRCTAIYKHYVVKSRNVHSTAVKVLAQKTITHEASQNFFVLLGRSWFLLCLNQAWIFLWESPHCFPRLTTSLWVHTNTEYYILYAYTAWNLLLWQLCHCSSCLLGHVCLSWPFILCWWVWALSSVCTLMVQGTVTVEKVPLWCQH